MRHLLATFLFLPFTLSCSESPPVQQAAPTESVAQVPDVKTPATEVQAELPSDEPPSVERTTRLAIGDVAPNFSLADQNGTDRILESLLATGKVAVVFHRSADW